jgi:hypothetical protein
MRQARVETSTAVHRQCEPTRHLATARIVSRGRSFARDPVDVSLLCIFVLMSALYVWRTAQVAPLALYGGATGQYNALADAFLHLHLWLAHFPASALHRESPNSPPAVLRPFGDDSVYNGNVYLTWGPTPALVLVPLHLLGFEPSPSVVISPFAIVGLAFALATLRICLRSLASVPLWMGVLSALVLACASVVLDLLRESNVYQESIASGYCFTMVGVYLAVSALVRGKSSLGRLSLMSLCFGLACGSRVTFYCTLALLVPIFLALKRTRRTRDLIAALVVPAGVCVVLLAAYNFARYGSLLETGEHHVIIAGAHEVLQNVSFIPVGMWSYLFTPPRVAAMFPFISVVAPQLAYPFAIPRYYNRYSDLTGGVLPMAPIVCFAVALPWVSRRRHVLFASLRPLLIAMVGTGLCMMVFASYGLPLTTERYEGDYMTLFILVSLVVWLSLYSSASGWRKRFVRISGGALAVWSCAAGVAVGIPGLQSHLGTWRTLVDITSPVSTAITKAVGHPILTEVWAPTIAESHGAYGLSAGPSVIWLSGEEQARLTIVSPGARYVRIGASFGQPSIIGSNAVLTVDVRGPGQAGRAYEVAATDPVLVAIVRVGSGVNEVTLGPVSVPLAVVSNIHLEPE